MEIVKYLHDPAAVLVFLGIALTPKAIVTSPFEENNN
jgi:hypothetical protein